MIRTVRSQFLQFVGLSGILLKSFVQNFGHEFPVRKIVRDSYLIPKAFLDIITES